MWLTGILIASVSVVGCEMLSRYFTAQQIGGLSQDLSRLFHSQCLFLVQSFSSLEQQEQIVKTTKSLDNWQTGFTHLKENELNKTAQEYRCWRNRPMYVLLAQHSTKENFGLMGLLPCYPRWLIFLDNTQPLGEFFKKVHIPFNCEVFVAQDTGSVIQLTEVYQVGVDTPLRRHIFGTWSSETGLQASKQSLNERRQNLEGILFKAVGMELEPHLTMTRDSMENILIGGLYGMIWNLLEAQLNFSTTVKNSTNEFEQFGALRNGTWVGLVSNVISGEADFVISGLSYQKDRMAAVDYLAPINRERIQLFVRKPTSERFQWTSFLSPFHPSLWLVVLSSILLSGGLLATAYKVGLLQNFEEQRVRDEFSFIRAVFHVLGLYCIQGTTFEPRAVSGRTVLLLAGLTSTVVVAAYSGALTSFITVQKLDLPYETIQEYVQDKEYQLEMTPNTYWLHFHVPFNDLYRAVHNRLVGHAHALIPNGQRGLQKICDSTGPFGWFASSEIAHVVKLSCEIAPVPEDLLALIETVVTTKGSPYTRLFKHKLLLMRETGILQRVLRLSNPGPPVDRNNEFPGVQLLQVVPLGAILGVGIACSLLLILVERSWNVTKLTAV